jgi:galactofuranose transport system permease protein
VSAPAFAVRPSVPRKVPPKFVPVLATLALLVVMFTIGAVRYPGFASGQVVLNVLIDNAFLLVVAIGMTFVILTGGIDLSVGAVVGLSTLVIAELIAHGWPPALAVLVALAIGAVLGFGMGCIIHYFEIQPFIVTLAGMFLARGLCYAITVDAISVQNAGYTRFATKTFYLPGNLFITTGVIVALVAVAIGMYVLHYTRLGRNVYAVGGNEHSALLMGLPVARTKIAVYTISGFCSALGGVLLSFYMLSGSGSLAIGMELDAIAAVVIGGTLLTGGTGYLAGSVLGVLVLGLIQTLINFQGTLSSWWTKIVIGMLLFAFILLQRVVFSRTKTGSRDAMTFEQRTAPATPS